MTRCPFRLNAIPPLNAMTDLGANNCHNDGSSDDTLHLEAGVAAAVAAGKRLYLPAGTGYALASQFDLISNLYMYGDGVGTVLLPAATYGLRLDGLSNVTLRDFKLDGNYSTSQFGIIMGAGHVTNITMTGLTIQDFLDSGIYGNCLASGIQISGCTLTNIRDFGIHFQHEHDPIFGLLGANGLVISDTTVIGIPGSAGQGPPHAIYVKVGANVTLSDCECGNIDTNALWDNDSAIEIDDVNTGTLTNCDVYGAVYGIQFSRYGTYGGAVGCQNINVYASGGVPDSCGNYERYEYLLNDITWDGECYGELYVYIP